MPDKGRDVPLNARSCEEEREGPSAPTLRTDDEDVGRLEMSQLGIQPRAGVGPSTMQ